MTSETHGTAAAPQCLIGIQQQHTAEWVGKTLSTNGMNVEYTLSKFANNVHRLRVHATDRATQSLLNFVVMPSLSCSSCARTTCVAVPDSFMRVGCHALCKEVKNNFYPFFCSLSNTYDVTDARSRMRYRMPTANEPLFLDANPWQCLAYAHELACVLRVR